MVDHIATYLLAYMLAFAALFVGWCIYSDLKAGYLNFSKPNFDK